LITDFIESYQSGPAETLYYNTYSTTCIKYLSECIDLFNTFLPFDPDSELLKDYVYLQYLREIMCDTMKERKKILKMLCSR